jgi:probable addiction module antidote protein
MTKLARETQLAREPLYRMLSEEGNPTFSSITAIVSSLGIQLQCVPTE